MKPARRLPTGQDDDFIRDVFVLQPPERPDLEVRSAASDRVRLASVARLAALVAAVGIATAVGLLALGVVAFDVLSPLFP